MPKNYETIFEFVNRIPKQDRQALGSIEGFHFLDPNMKVLGAYENGNYKIVYLEDGSKLRYGFEDSLTPEYPECIDLTITKKCSYECPFCYMGCTPDGKHADLFDLGEPNKILSQIPPGTELAVNGNDLDHPDLLMFLIWAQAHEIFVNITVRDYHFMKHFETLKLFRNSGLIHGIGVSHDFQYDREFISRCQELGSSVVVHTIAGMMDLVEWNYLRGQNLNLLILGYKDIGRGKSYMETNGGSIKERTEGLEELLKYVYQNERNRLPFRSIGFDGLAIEQLHVKDWVGPAEYKRMYSGNEGAYSFYLDLVNNQYSISSINPTMIPCGDLTVKQIFDSIKTEPLSNKEG